MSSGGPGPVVLTPESWFILQLQAIYDASSPQQLNTAFNNFLSLRAEIIVNGGQMPRDRYFEIIKTEKAEEGSSTPAQITVKGAATTQSDNDGVYILGLFVTVTLTSAFFVLGSRQTNTLDLSINAVITNEEEFLGGGEGRTVKFLSEVIVDENNNFKLP